jgi:hypothetical protein
MQKETHSMSEQSKTKPSTSTESSSGTPIVQRAQPGYYPGWDVTTQWAFWDQATRDVVEKRLAPPEPLRFFNATEAALMTAVLDRVLPQDDRLPEKRIALLPVLDDRLHANRIEGYRYEDMPSDQQAYRWAAEAFEAMTMEAHGTSFVELAVNLQETLLQSLHDGEPLAAKELWKRMNVDRFWTMLVSDACSAYYAHPLAWNEVGFGGPAYPRGYMRLEEGEAEPWEFAEKRYEWIAPADSISDRAQSIGKGEEQQTHQGQAGTH